MKVNAEFTLYAYHYFSAQECRLLAALIPFFADEKLESIFSSITGREQDAHLLIDNYKHTIKEVSEEWEKEGVEVTVAKGSEWRELVFTKEEITVARLAYKHGEKVVFIKYLRERYNFRLKEAKHVMDLVWDQIRANKETQMSA